MTLITNPDANIRTTIQDVQDFFLNILGIDISTKALSITYDGIGRIAQIDVDQTLTGPESDQVIDEFFIMSLKSIILSLLTPANATSFLTDQGASTPTAITIGAADTLTDITIVDNWNLGADASLFTLTNDDTGEVQYTGTVPKTVMVTFALTYSVVSSFDHIYSAIMRTPDGESATEVPGTRIHTETINGSDGQSTSNCAAILLQPLDKLKINVANSDGMTDIEVSIATMCVR